MFDLLYTLRAVVFVTFCVMGKLQTFVENIQTSQNTELAFAALNTALHAYGYDNALLTLMTDHDSIDKKAFHGIATSFPDDWVKHYNSTGLHAIDPVYQAILKGHAPFFWSDLEKRLASSNALSDLQKKTGFAFMRDAEDAGVADGIGVSFQNEFGEVSGLGISRRANANENRFDVLSDIYILTSVFHEKYFSFFRTTVPTNLSGREREVLLWASSGKTDHEIATILNISRATVRFHWKNVFEKLNVTNRVAATVRAVQARHIVPNGLELQL